ncbi:hypothetical protein ABID16_003871 [Rhizobium aquaticum]|uniref:Uncharacterized protein n=1 Tax=Rhizobium aquaticum TaxID=1549636 RepID=A0ABV2J440_9HYPH
MTRRLKSVSKKVALAAALPLAVFLLFATVFAITGEAPAALVIFPPARDPAGLPEDIEVLRWDGQTAVVTSDNLDYVRRLYQSGAVLVLPFRKSGCLALQPSRKPAV